jgi:predicted transcriptional regulator
LKRGENEKMGLHIKYLSVIFTIVSLGLLSLVFMESTSAISSLSYASTLLSIVLAVIAILITLWDVAGQKNTIHDIKSETEKLKETVVEFKNAYSNADEVINSIKELQEDLVNKINNTTNISESILDGIKSIKSLSDMEEKNKKIEELENQLENTLASQKKEKDKGGLAKLGYRYTTRNKVCGFIISEYTGREFSFREVVRDYEVKNRIRVPFDLVESALNHLIEEGVINMKEINGEKIYQF